MVVVEDGSTYAWQPIGAPLNLPKDDNWTHFDNSVNAVSFGFVATAILISMFLVMAIFERFLRPPSPPPVTSSGDRRHMDLEAQQHGFGGKLGYPSPKTTMYSHGVSVLMPGDNMPSYIAYPAPVPCPPERLSWSHHQHSPPDLSIDSRTNAVQENLV